MTHIRKRVTYANVMSTIAVFLVLGGATAFAASKIGANQLQAGAVATGKIKNNAVTSAKLRNEAVTTAKLKNNAATGAKVDEGSLGQVPSAKSAESAITATSATSATTAETANPPAFAVVGVNGTVDPNTAKGITEANVTHPAKGAYCITPQGFTARGGQATPQFGGSNGTTANLTIGGTGNCPFPAVQVLMFTGGATPEFSNIGFNVVLYH